MIHDCSFVTLCTPPVRVLATALFLSFGIPRDALGQQAAGDLPNQDLTAVDIPTETLTAFARAHVEISSVRDSLYDAFGRVHDAQGKALLREKLDQRVAQILEAEGLTGVEFEQITFVISVDATRREEFETILAGLDPAARPRQPEASRDSIRRG